MTQKRSKSSLKTLKTPKVKKSRVLDLSSSERDKLNNAYSILKKFSLPPILNKPWKNINRNAEKFRNYYIAIIQTINLEGKEIDEGLRSHYSSILLNAINSFFQTFLYRLRMKIIEHLQQDNFFSDLSIWDSIQKGKEEDLLIAKFEEFPEIKRRISEEFHGVIIPEGSIDLFEELFPYGESRPRFFTEHWDLMVKPYYQIIKNRIIENPIIKKDLPEASVKWFEIQEGISKYLNPKFKKEINPIILFDNLRDVEHHHGAILSEWFWTLNDIEEFVENKEKELGRKELEIIIRKWQKKEWWLTDWGQIGRKMMWEEFNEKLKNAVKNFEPKL